MKSKTVDRLLKSTPKDIEIFVDQYADLTVRINQLLRENNISKKGTYSTRKETIAQLKAIEIFKNESRILSFDEYLFETQNPANYAAPEGSTRDKRLDKVKKLLKGDKANKKKAYMLRDKMEAKERNKPGWKNTPRTDSKSTKNNKN